MKLKLRCTLRINTNVESADIAEDINVIDLPDDMADEKIKSFFDNLRKNMKVKYMDVVQNLLEVEIKEIK